MIWAPKPRKGRYLLTKLQSKKIEDFITTLMTQAKADQFGNITGVVPVINCIDKQEEM